MINNNTPHTPRKRGAEIASSENYSLALDLWRATCAEAGLAFIVDNCTANGARKVAARYLDTGTLTPEAVKGAMRKLAYLITHSEKAQHYTLNALGNNISRRTVCHETRPVGFHMYRMRRDRRRFLPGGSTAKALAVYLSRLSRFDDSEKGIRGYHEYQQQYDCHQP